MRKTLFLLGFYSLVLAGVAACSTVPTPTVTQIAPISSLLAGGYDGQLPAEDMLRYGDFGIGTFDKLDGEMIVLDGNVYQAKVDGNVHKAPPNLTIPYATVVKFEAAKTVPVKEGAHLNGLEETINRALPNRNVFAAVKVHGLFAKVKVRSVPSQVKPYPPLVEAAKKQAVFDYENVSGTIVGFRAPSFMNGASVPGYHLHFISDDRTKGGHLLEFTVVNASAEMGAFSQFFLILPEGTADFSRTDLSIDRSKDLEKVER